MHYKFSAYNDQAVLLCFKRYLFLWFKSFTDSRVRCKWVLFNCSQLHMLSLEFVLGFCHGIAIGGDCKVEFNQPYCWLYFVPKFVCNLAISNPVFRWESCKGSVWESVKKCWNLCKVVGTHDWISRVAHGLQATRSCTHAKHAEKLKRHASWSTTGQKVQTGHLASSRLKLPAQSSRKAKLPTNFVLEKLTLRIPNTHKYKYPSYPQNIKSFQREY